jgi:hypothetical protein
MARGHKSHPDTDTRGDTIEFAAVELEQPERVCYELRGGTGVSFNSDLDFPVEIRVGQTTESSPLFLHQGTDFPELCETEGHEPFKVHVLIQPDVFAKNPKLGWMVVTEYAEVGRTTHSQFRFGRDISRRGHIALSPPNQNHRHFEIVGASSNPTKVIVDGREHPLWNYELGSP